MQDRKSKLTQAIDKIITQKIEEADCNNKLDQAINKLLIYKIGKGGFKTYIEKLEDYDSESEDDLKDIISIRKPAIKNLVTTNDM